MTSILSCVLLALRVVRLVPARAAGLARRLTRHVRAAGDAGMSTAEYAVGTVAAVAFAVVLYKVVRSPAVATALSGIIRSALHTI